MKNRTKKSYSQTAQRRMIIELINDSFRLAESRNRHPLRKGCNCIVCINKRKRILEKRNEKEWKFKL